MATKRRRFTAEFKARVATEALRGDRTIQAIAAKHEVHPNQVSGWKRQAQEVCGRCSPVPPTAAKPTMRRSSTTCTRRSAS